MQTYIFINLLFTIIFLTDINMQCSENSIPIYQPTIKFLKPNTSYCVFGFYLTNHPLHQKLSGMKSLQFKTLSSKSKTIN